MKAIPLIIFSLLSVINGVIAQDKTLRVVNAAFRARPLSSEDTNPEVDSAVLDCTIEEDDVSFKLSLRSPDLQRLYNEILFIELEGTENRFAVTRSNDQIPLPKSVPNPDRDAMPETNELYERMEADGQDMTDVVPYENVLDRSFVLDIAYQTVQDDYYQGTIEISPEQVDNILYIFIKRNLNLRFPMRLVQPNTSGPRR